MLIPDKRDETTQHRGRGWASLPLSKHPPGEMWSRGTLPTLLPWDERPLVSWGPRQPSGVFARVDTYCESLICAFIFSGKFILTPGVLKD